MSSYQIMGLNHSIKNLIFLSPMRFKKHYKDRLVNSIYFDTDELMFYKGYVHLINGTKEQKNIELIFPSGESRKANIHPGKSRTFFVLNTGEGSITVNLDGQEIDKVGYVVVPNSPIAIVAMEDRAIFSIISIQR